MIFQLLLKKQLILFLVILFLLAGCQKAPSDRVLAESESSAPVPESEQLICDDCADEEPLKSIRISELMPSNGVCIYDRDGDSSDWLELTNTGDQTVSLKGCSLAVRENSRETWQLPDVSLAGGERVVVFCSGKNRTDSELHASFTLEKNGDTVALFSPSGVLLDSVTYPEIAKDMSIVFPSGVADANASPEYRITYQATPGFPDTEEGYEDYLAASDLHGPLIINEAVSYNNTFPEKPGRYYDWLELKNSSDETIQLGDYYLSDQPDKAMGIRLPDVSLDAGKTFIVFCSGDSSLTSETYFHADFAIGTEDRLYITGKDGNRSDRLFVHDIPLYGSIGRMDGKAGFWYFSSPTPNQENDNGYRRVSAEPAASVLSGVFQNDKPLQIELSGKGTIYYTLDGSVPDTSDPVYSDPITVTKTTVIRAVSEEENSMISAPATFSYILNENESLPVTSLVCEPKEMFGYNGVYSAPRALNAKCDATVTFFDTNGSGFTSDCSVELHGAHSRTTFKKKSFELKFSSRYGGDVEYDLFGDGIRTRFSTLLLRGGSTANLDTVRDCFVSTCMLEVCPWLFPQNTRYTSVYINGEYYGIYAWREAYSDQYFADHTGMPDEGILMVRGPVSGGELFQLLNEIAEKTVSSDSEYERFASRLDMNSLAGWMAIQSFFDNQDINGNIRYVRLAENGKWQLIVYDLDYSCLTNTTGWSTVLSSYQLGPVCRSLLGNSHFRDLLLQTCAEFVQNGFTADHLLELYDGLLEPLDEATVQRECQRWADQTRSWEKNKKAMRNHLNDSRMVDWLAGLKSLTKATDEQMHALFPQYY